MQGRRRGLGFRSPKVLRARLLPLRPIPPPLQEGILPGGGERAGGARQEPVLQLQGGPEAQGQVGGEPSDRI